MMSGLQIQYNYPIECIWVHGTTSRVVVEDPIVYQCMVTYTARDRYRINSALILQPMFTFVGTLTHHQKY